MTITVHKIMHKNVVPDSKMQLCGSQDNGAADLRCINYTPQVRLVTLTMLQGKLEEVY